VIRVSKKPLESARARRSQEPGTPRSVLGTKVLGTKALGTKALGTKALGTKALGKKRPERTGPKGVARASQGRASDSEDVALICGKAEDGESLHIVRKRGDEVQAGLLRPLKEGKPIDGDLVRLRPRAEFPLLCDVEVEMEMPKPSGLLPAPARAEASGPPQVATDDYRRNWDLIWKRAATKDRSLN
jgi:hypothetical protein